MWVNGSHDKVCIPVAVVGKGVVAGECQEHTETRAQGEENLCGCIHPHLRRGEPGQQGRDVTPGGY